MSPMFSQSVRLYPDLHLKHDERVVSGESLRVFQDPAVVFGVPIGLLVGPLRFEKGMDSPFQSLAFGQHQEPCIPGKNQVRVKMGFDVEVPVEDTVGGPFHLCTQSVVGDLHELFRSAV